MEERVLSNERHLGNSVGFGEHRENDIDLLRHVGRRLGPRRTLVKKRLRLVLGAVMDDKFMSLLEKIGGHAAAHDAKSDESDLHVKPPS